MTMTRYSLDDQNFNAEHAHEVLDELWHDGRLVAGARYYKCDFRTLTFADVCSADLVLDDASDRASGLLGEAAECDDPLFVDAAAKQELDNLLTAWAKDHVSLEHYWIATGSSEEVLVDADTVAQYVKAHA